MIFVVRGNGLLFSNIDTKHDGLENVSPASNMTILGIYVNIFRGKCCEYHDPVEECCPSKYCMPKAGDAIEQLEGPVFQTIRKRIRCKIKVFSKQDLIF